ncbi:MAG: DUF1538 domain-containing protein [Oscillospiraceae bacterium]|nr:DUF1538 domain-containing protein [Oscillospiraceae bacterium]MBR3084008.1 DUF1538 domain-containing protein [Oscillospiraceae bacterium]MBR6097045.1 DUF1538 domain-containing protein [Oscillospiraceae bacterium]
MRTALRNKLWEATVSILPIALMVLLISFTPLAELSDRELGVFLLSSLLLILGIGLFNLGADLAMTPMGEHTGEGLTKSNRPALLLWASFILGLLITVAEPDLAVLAGQVRAVLDGTLLVFTVGVGVGLFLLLAVLKILFRKDLSSLLLFFYLLLFALAALLLETGRGGFLPMAFDSGGVTTGPITVPFIMALGVGIAMTVGGRDAHSNSFGLIALCSVGPVLAVLLLSLAARGEMQYALPDYSLDAHLGPALWHTLLEVMAEVGRSLLLIALVFGLLQVTVLRLPRRKLLQLAVGALYTFLGLVIFLTAVTVGFMPVGFRLGLQLAEGNQTALVILGFVIGMVVVLAEPAVHVLNLQVEEITAGEVTKRQMMLALSVGVGVSIGLSLLRILLGFSLLYYLIPGYLISLGLSFFVPRLYTAIAFDSGGVASGPLTSSFILPMAIGACVTLRGEQEVLSSAFGIVSMVAMTPLITIQALGFRAVLAAHVRRRRAMRRILSADDAQIIYFEY